jgi:hypothetical protein
LNNLVIGGYAVNYYGCARATAYLDIRIGITPGKAESVARVVNAFGFSEAKASTFPEPGLEILTTISGVEFAECYARRLRAVIDEVTVNLIRIEDLKRDRKASGRLRDLPDVERLS